MQLRRARQRQGDARGAQKPATLGTSGEQGCGVNKVIYPFFEIYEHKHAVIVGDGARFRDIWEGKGQVDFDVTSKAHVPKDFRPKSSINGSYVRVYSQYRVEFLGFLRGAPSWCFQEISGPGNNGRALPLPALGLKEDRSSIHTDCFS